MELESHSATTPKYWENYSCKELSLLMYGEIWVWAVFLNPHWRRSNLLCNHLWEGPNIFWIRNERDLYSNWSGSGDIAQEGRTSLSTSVVSLLSFHVIYSIWVHVCYVLLFKSMVNHGFIFSLILMQLIFQKMNLDWKLA